MLLNSIAIFKNLSQKYLNEIWIICDKGLPLCYEECLDFKSYSSCFNVIIIGFLFKNPLSFPSVQDLQHPNEFIRGSTLRFLCKLRQPELIEPLMPAIRACLDHRHSYVRRNAVLAIYTIYRFFINFCITISDPVILVMCWTCKSICIVLDIFSVLSGVLFIRSFCGNVLNISKQSP